MAAAVISNNATIVESISQIPGHSGEAKLVGGAGGGGRILEGISPPLYFIS